MDDQACAVTIDLRRSDQADVECVREWEAAPETAAWLGETGAAWHATALSDPDVEHLVATVEGHVVGFAVLSGCTTEPRVIELRRIAVHPTARGAHLGRRFLRLLLERAYGRHRAVVVWLDVKVENRRARALYDSEGFIATRTDPGALLEPDGRRSDLLIMEHRRDDGRCPLGGSP